MAFVAPRAYAAWASRPGVRASPMCTTGRHCGLFRGRGACTPRVAIAHALARGVSSPSSGRKSRPAMDPAMLPREEVAFGAEVEVLAAGAVDAGLFEADLSAAALLAELEQASAQLGDFLTTDAPPLDLAAAWPDDGTGMMQGENGMFNTTPADKLLIKEAVMTRRKEAKAEKAAIKAEKRARAEKRAERRAERHASEEVAPAAPALQAAQVVEAAAVAEAAAAPAVDVVAPAESTTANRGGPAGPGPASAPVAPLPAAAAAAAAAAAVEAPGAAVEATAVAPVAADTATVAIVAPPSPRASLTGRRAMSEPLPAAALSIALPPAPVARRSLSIERSQRRAARGRTQGAATRDAAAAVVGALPATGGRRAAAAAAAAEGADGRTALSGVFKETRNELLSAEQERKLYEMVQEHLRIEAAGRELTESLGRPPTDEEWAAAIGAETVEAFIAARSTAATAKAVMVKSNMRLVVSICKKYQHLGMSLSDLISEGIAGLVRGVEKFDATKGFKFSTYAHWWIRQGVTRAVTDQGRLVRIPVHMQELISRVTRTRKELEATFGRNPSNKEVAKAMGVEEEKIAEMYAMLQSVRSLEGAAGGTEGEGGTLGDTVEDQSAMDADEASMMAGLKDDMIKLLERLPTREAAVMRMRYGLDGEQYTLDDIGRVLKVTRERVRQIEAKALRALRSNMGAMEESVGEYSGLSFDTSGMAARTSSGTKKT